MDLMSPVDSGQIPRCLLHVIMVPRWVGGTPLASCAALGAEGCASIEERSYSCPDCPSA